MPGPRVLGQSAGTGAAVDVYTSPPSGAGTIVATIAIINTTGAAATAAVAVAPGGATAAAIHTLLPAHQVAPGDTQLITTPITLAPSDVLRATAGTGVNVHAYGSEL